MPAFSDNNREKRVPHAECWLTGALTPTALLRSIALSLMDTADLVAAWLLSGGTDPDSE